MAMKRYRSAAVNIPLAASYSNEFFRFLAPTRIDWIGVGRLKPKELRWKSCAPGYSPRSLATQGATDQTMIGCGRNKIPLREPQPTCCLTA
jgi:hypothetical protein